MSDLLQPKMGQIFKYIGKCYIPEQVYRVTNTQIYSLNSTPQIKNTVYISRSNNFEYKKPV